ncbi:uncharacterized protein LOC119684482 [Teleopsis dalmanni]|uniref:uncharacterized protein LOC119684482 n=1 Tax=Teleopsis dalmanni TaxID=139649 RepID=UPI0018CCB686|nr:uncharacterized protein LOC119684482 [Teleopsis dalmanni]
MRPTFDRRLWILLFIILVQCTISTKQQNIKPQNSNHVHKPADPAPTWRSLSIQSTPVLNNSKEKSFLRTTDDNILSQAAKLKKSNTNVFKQQQELNVFTQKCAKNCLETNKSAQLSLSPAANPISTVHSDQIQHSANKYSKPFQLPLMTAESAQSQKSKSPAKSKAKKIVNSRKVLTEHAKVHIAHRSLHKEVQLHRQPHEHHKIHNKPHSTIVNTRIRRATERLHALNTLDANNDSVSNEEFTVSETTKKPVSAYNTALLEQISFTSPSHFLQKQQYTTTYYNESISQLSSHDGVHLLAFAQRPFSVLAPKTKRSRSTVTMPVEKIHKVSEPMIIIDDGEEFDSGNDHELAAVANADDKSEDYSHDEPLEPRVLPLRPVPPNPYEDEEMSVVYAEQHSEIRLMCEVDLDIAASMWYKNGQVVHAIDRTSRATDYRFIKEANGALTITNVMLEDDGKWQCEAENTRRYTENARPVKLVVLDRPKSPYLLIDSRRLDAGNIFVPVKENSELNLACVSEGGNPKPLLTWEVLLSPGVDRHAQKVSAEVLELEEIKSDKVVHAIDRTSRATDYRFIKEANGALTITNVMLEDDGKWQCEAENTRRYTENARPVKLVVLDRPKSPYLLIDSRRLDAGNIFVPVKENSELNLACVSEGGNPKPLLTWEVLLSPGVDRHAQKVSAEVLELEEIKSDKVPVAY